MKRSELKKLIKKYTKELNESSNFTEPYQIDSFLTTVKFNNKKMEEFWYKFIDLVLSASKKSYVSYLSGDWANVVVAIGNEIIKRENLKKEADKFEF